MTLENRETILPSLTVEDFTVFADERFEFSPQLNIIVGTNGTGKTHLLKLVYAILKQVARPASQRPDEKPTKGSFDRDFARRLEEIFLPDELGRLVRKASENKKCEITSRLFGEVPLRITFSSKSTKEVNAESVPSEWRDEQPVYFPTQELLTIAPTFPSLFRKYRLPFSQVYEETCELLNGPALRKTNLDQQKKLLLPIEKALGGEIFTDKTGRFYIQRKDGPIEIHLAAEGHRKLGMLARLIANGNIQPGTTLLWDEPEANLNPEIIKILVEVILELTASGVQIFIATHSLFMLREFELLMMRKQYQSVKGRFIGLHAEENGVKVRQGDSVDDIGAIASLSEDLRQSDRLMDTYGEQHEVG